MGKKLKVSEAEKITLQTKNGTEHYFYIAPDPDSATGEYLAFTQNSIWRNLPHFNLVCTDKDEAFAVGVKAYQLHFKQ